jgi:hypothetical protein
MAFLSLSALYWGFIWLSWGVFVMGNTKLYGFFELKPRSSKGSANEIYKF